MLPIICVTDTRHVLSDIMKCFLTRVSQSLLRRGANVTVTKCGLEQAHQKVK